MSRLMTACAYERDVRMCRGPVSDAQAIVIDEQEAVMYNPSFLDGLDDETGNPWASISVVAHELGHHFYGHGRLGTSGVAAESILDCELAADYFSGYVLSRVGASLADAQSAQRYLAGEETESHPDSASRLRAIEAGWRDGHAALAIATNPVERMKTLPVVVIPDQRARDGILPATLEARLDRW
jgi:hypothetical protein